MSNLICTSKQNSETKIHSAISNEKKLKEYTKVDFKFSFIFNKLVSISKGASWTNDYSTSVRFLIYQQLFDLRLKNYFFDMSLN